jgi:hypothetical protein
MNLLLEVPGIARSRRILLFTAVMAAMLWLPLAHFVDSLMQSTNNAAATQAKPADASAWDLRAM